jgi:DNA (cytosine-5)-methyltransferase 1
MPKPRLLDLFSGAGGCTRGYQLAGFDVVGVDLKMQPNYCGSEFYIADAVALLESLVRSGIAGMNLELDQFHAIHASPPCQAYTTLRTLQGGKDYPDLVGPVRDLLEETGLPYVIENVVGAPLLNPVQLCGSSFGLRIRRHRLFEANFPIMAPPCAHYWQQDRIYPALNGDDRKRGGRSGIVGVYGNGGDKRADLWPKEMGIDWMSRDELTQAIPPAYTEHIGHYLLAHIQQEAKAA